MEKTPNAGEQITLETAIELTNDFRKQYPEAVKANLVSASNIQSILAQPGCVGIRIYNGYDTTTGKITPVLVGTDANDNDLYNGVIMDRAVPCPSCCDANSPLFQ